MKEALLAWLYDGVGEADALVGALRLDAEAFAQAIALLDALPGADDEAEEALTELLEAALAALPPALRRARAAAVEAGPRAAAVLRPYAAEPVAEIDARLCAWLFDDADAPRLEPADLPDAFALLDALDALGALAEGPARLRFDGEVLAPLEALIEASIGAEGGRGALAGLGADGALGPAAATRLTELATLGAREMSVPEDAGRATHEAEIAARATTLDVLRPPVEAPRPPSRARWMVAAAALLTAVGVGLALRDDPAPAPPPVVETPPTPVAERPAAPPWPWAPSEPPTKANTEATAYRPALRAIEAGQFLMGSPPDEPERAADETQRVVRLTRSFWLARTEVTQGQWAALMGNQPARFPGDPERPVERVSWFDALAYLNALSAREGRAACYRLDGCEGAPGRPDHACAEVEFAGLDCPGYRLPTESEWEYAARAGTGTATYAGPLVLKGERHAPVLDAIAWYSGNSGVEAGGMDCSDWPETQRPAARCATHPVGRKAPNAWGLHDMLGNVWEWTHDRYDPRATDAPAIDPTGAPAGPRRVTKGCGWFRDARFCRAANRYRPLPTYRSSVVGFRPARTIPPAEDP